MTDPTTARWVGTPQDPVNGDWLTVADWTNGGATPLGAVPDANDAVVLQDGTVTFDTTDEIYSISSADSAGVLDMTGGALTVDNTGSVASINVDTGATLNAAAGASVELTGQVDGTLAGAGAFVLDSGTVIGSAGLSAPQVTFNGVELTNTLTYAGAQITFDANGTTVTDGASLTVTSTNINFANSGSVAVVDAATLTFGSDAGGAGTIYLAGGSTAEIHNFATGSVAFLDSRDTLKLDDPAAFGGTIVGFAQDLPVAADTIDLVGVDVTTVTNVSFAGQDPSGGDLVVKDGSTVLANLNLEGNYVGQTFLYKADASGTGTDITLACYRRGTRIRTVRGEQRIEDLAIGDAVMTVSREPLPIRWIGLRSYGESVAAGNAQVAPILFRAGSLGPQVPLRDLWVSPEHAMYLDGVLIAARDLVNGMSIIRGDTGQQVTYLHLEFDAHVVIFAEGAPSESYLDDGNREMFDNAADYSRRYPDSLRLPATFCAPRVCDGWELEGLRRRLAAQALDALPGLPRAARSLSSADTRLVTGP